MPTGISRQGVRLMLRRPPMREDSVARPVDHERRREIAVQALQVLREQGLQQATMSGLANSLGLKRPTLYFYFPSIGDLFLTLLEIHREEEVAYVANRMQSFGHPIDVLLSFLRAEREFIVDKGLDDLMLMMASFWASGSEEDREKFRARVLKDLLPARQIFTALLEQGQAAGFIADCDSEGIVDLIFCIQDGLLVQAGIRELDAERVFAAIQALLEPLRINA